MAVIIDIALLALGVVCVLVFLSCLVVMGFLMLNLVQKTPQ